MGQRCEHTQARAASRDGQSLSLCDSADVPERPSDGSPAGGVRPALGSRQASPGARALSPMQGTRHPSPPASPPGPSPASEPARALPAHARAATHLHTAGTVTGARGLQGSASGSAMGHPLRITSSTAIQWLPPSGRDPPSPALSALPRAFFLLFSPWCVRDDVVRSRGSRENRARARARVLFAHPSSGPSRRVAGAALHVPPSRDESTLAEPGLSTVLHAEDAGMDTLTGDMPGGDPDTTPPAFHMVPKWENVLRAQS